MKPTIEILNGDCLQYLKWLEDNSVDSLVTDPPAGISFMGKSRSWANLGMTIRAAGNNG